MSTTPPAQPPSHYRKASTAVPSRPTTPLRSVSRTSLRASQTTPSASLAGSRDKTALEPPLARLEPAFAELSDGMADLEANFIHLQLLNESMARFNENFAAFHYGLNMNAFCVDFPEAPVPQSFARHGSKSNQLENSPFRDYTQAQQQGDGHAPDATFLTTDTSFVENPPTSSKSFATGKYGGAAGSKRGTAAGRGGAAVRGRGVSGATGARGTASRTTTGVARASAAVRGTARGRGVVR